MGQLLKLKCSHSLLNLRILSSISVPFSLTTVLNFVITHTRQITVHGSGCIHLCYIFCLCGVRAQGLYRRSIKYLFNFPTSRISWQKQPRTPSSYMQQNILAFYSSLFFPFLWNLMALVFLTCYTLERTVSQEIIIINKGRVTHTQVSTVRWPFGNGPRPRGWLSQPENL